MLFNCLSCKLIGLLCLIFEISCQGLEMDEGYLTVNNKNCNGSRILMNPIICEECDLEEKARVDSYSNVTLKISTQYAYDLQIELLASNGSLYCHLKSYKFEEYGNYLIEINENVTNEYCSVIQRGETSSYWSPIIIGVSIWLILLSLVELGYYLNRKKIFHRIASKKRFESETIPLMDHSSNENVDVNHSKVKSKRFQSLDALRGLALMIMIFVNYGGMSHIS